MTNKKPSELRFYGDSFTPIVRISGTAAIVTHMIGILINGESFARALLHMGYAFGMIAGLQDPVIKVEMPCGTKAEYRLDTFPLTDKPCPCGDPEHWLVRYEYKV